MTKEIEMKRRTLLQLLCAAMVPWNWASLAGKAEAKHAAHIVPRVADKQRYMVGQTNADARQYAAYDYYDALGMYLDANKQLKLERTYYQYGHKVGQVGLDALVQGPEPMAIWLIVWQVQ